MKLHTQTPKQDSGGYALIIVLSFIGVGFLLVSGSLTWSANSSMATERRNTYYKTLAAAEAGTEKVLSQLAKDFQDHGEAVVYQNLQNYRASAPSVTEDAYWGNYSFTDTAGGLGNTSVERVNPSTWTELASQYKGLRGAAATYRIQSNAQDIGSRHRVSAGVLQEIQATSIPIFQFAIFYSVELELNPGPVMNITGRVHSNTNLYCNPENAIIYHSDVTAAGTINHNQHPNDPGTPGNGTITYLAEHDAGVSSLNLPIGTNNTPESVYAILEVPPTSEDVRSAMGQQRYYNKCDIVIDVSNTGVSVKSGAYNNFATTIGSTSWSTFLTTNKTFYNAREGKVVQTTEFNVAAFKTWAEAANVLTAGLGGRVASSVYIRDSRSVGTGKQPGVRVINGSTLPRDGLTIATPQPLYVKGHFNAPTSALGTLDTSGTKPASLVGDAITVLSTAWSDSNASNYTARVAGDTTINAAFLAGIVPTGLYGGVKKYSGGVENFPRFLENWSSKTFTYSGSMVVMYYSKIATTPWGGSNVYSPPTRNWAFDVNFLDPIKLPPGTPMMRTMIRGTWTAVGVEPSNL